MSAICRKMAELPKSDKPTISGSFIGIGEVAISDKRTRVGVHFIAEDIRP